MGNSEIGLSWKDCQSIMADEALALGLKFSTYKFHYGKIGSRLLKGEYVSPMWGSIWVTNPEGIQIGRLIFKEGVFSHSKVYGAGRFPKDKIWASLEAEAQRSAK